MKELLLNLFLFALTHGVRDKEKFREHAVAWLEKYSLDEEKRDEFIEAAYAFLTGLAVRLQQTQVVRTGVRQGVSSLEDQMEDLNKKLDRILANMSNSTS